jgi:hypothetical protein
MPLPSGVAGLHVASRIVLQLVYVMTFFLWVRKNFSDMCATFKATALDSVRYSNLLIDSFHISHLILFAGGTRAQPS